MLPAQSSAASDAAVNTLTLSSLENTSACLGTFLTRLRLSDGAFSSAVRGFCDSGSQVNLIAESCVRAMRLSREKTTIPINGVGSSTCATGIVNVIIAHRTNDSIQVPIRALVVSQISSRLPDTSFKSPFDETLPIEELADPTYNKPGAVHLLLGAGAWAAIIDNQMLRKRQDDNHAIAQSTLLGWVVYGQLSTMANIRLHSCHVTTDIKDARIDQLLIKYWNADSFPLNRQWTPEEQRAEDIFISTHHRDSTGRFVVHIPLKSNAKPLGNSHRAAKACFYGIEKRLSRDSLLFAQYKAVMDDYRATRHMVLAPEKPVDDAASYYIPHHAINTAGKKGKFRIVFNGSAPSSNGISFNDQQLPGPRLQDDLIVIFLRFRAHRYGMTADIKQMFRQVNVAPEFWNYQRMFWRDAQTEELLEYVITVVCWGQTSAGFNAVRSVRQCAIDGQCRFPIGARMALEDLYYDDLLSGDETESGLLSAYNQVSRLLNTGHFELSKWATNSQLLSKTMKGDLSTEVDVPIDAGVLGMRWHTQSDTLRIRLSLNAEFADQQMTKRKLISATSQIFDPIGLVLPVIVTGKILQQDTWRSGIAWDERLPAELQEKWIQYRNSVAALDEITVPRWLNTTPNDRIQVHIFVDASELAIGAVAYFRITNSSGETAISLITARSKVAPVKKLTIPRLELTAAVLGAQLSQFIRSTYRLESVEFTFWTDSTIVIHWLRKDPNLCRPFVANRIIAIREMSENGIWRHIQGSHNSADLLTRGMTAVQLKGADLWWHGPPWLIDRTEDWPLPTPTTVTPEIQSQIESEHKPMPPDHGIIHCKSKTGRLVSVLVCASVTALGITNDDGVYEALIDRHSELSSLLRVTTYVQRFIVNSRAKARQRRITKHPIQHHKVSPCNRSAIKPASNVECRNALLYWVRNAQMVFYSKEYSAIRAGRQIAVNSTIVKLCPFVDSNRLLRVGGRLANANVPEDAKHQFIIPPHARISNLLIWNAHYATVHGGPQLMMPQLRHTFWIHRMRQVVKSVVYHCAICTRFNQPPNAQLMGQLPPERVQRSEPFMHTGVDFAGPFVIRQRKGRPPTIERCKKIPKTSTQKAWIVIFICLATRAVHIDVLLGLTIEEFLAAFQRFIMRKGRCVKLVSDNGMTFVGSDKELARVLHQWSNSLPEHNLSQFNTEWQFIPPAAPHKGGIWEAAVGSMKRHLKKTMGVRMFTKDELYQVATHIEGCLNSRPLWPISDDPSDPLPLTPAHFVLGKAILPQPMCQDVAELRENELTIWGQRQQLQQQLWSRWRDEFLATQQVRTKWYKIEENLKIGDMVIVRKENTPPAMWIIGRVVKVFAGKDGIVRSATIKTPTGDLDRPINKLVYLPQPSKGSVDQPINGGECSRYSTTRKATSIKPLR